MTQQGEDKGSSALRAKMPFIVSSNVDKADPATRKLIRSHVMQGKKKNKIDTIMRKQRLPNDRASSSSIKMPEVKLEELEDLSMQQVPSRVGSDISFIELSDEVEPSVILNIVKIAPTAMRIIFPLKMTIGFQADYRDWLYLVRPDTAALHISAFAIEGFIAKFLRRQEDSPVAMLHFQKGLKLLRERLLGDDDGMKVSDSTMGVVVKLASAAFLDGENLAAQRHMEGLRKMVDLRGGLDMFKGKHLHMEMFRCDLGIALHTGSRHVFFRQPSEPMIPYPEKLLEKFDKKSRIQDNVELGVDLGSDLETAWRAMRRFCLLVNLGTQTSRMIPPDLIYDTMTAVMYRLLSMHFAVGSIDEIMRLGLLAFSYHVFLQWQDVRLPYAHFPNAYKRSLLGVRHEDGISSRLMLWLLMTGSNSIFSISEEEWLRDLLLEHSAKCKLIKWKEMHDLLKSFMWISLMDERPGELIFEQIQLDRR